MRRGGKMIHSSWQINLSKRCVLAIQFFALAAGISVVFQPPAMAAKFDIVGEKLTRFTISREETPHCNVRLSGPIKSGDLDRLKQALRELSSDRRYSPYTLCLNSNGGSYNEGVDIASFVLNNHMKTMIEEGAKCYSACALIFMSGGYRHEGFHIPYRKLHVRGELGFHAPYMIGGAKGEYEVRDLYKSYRAAIQAIRDLVRLGRDQRVSKRFMPKSIIAELLDKGPDEFFKVDTVFKAIRLYIFLYGGQSPNNVTINMQGNACQNLFHETGLQVSLDEPPSRWMPKGIRKATRKGNQVWFSGFGGEGTYYCVTKTPGEYGTLFDIYPELITDRTDIKSVNFYSAPYWYLYPPSTRIAALPRAGERDDRGRQPKASKRSYWDHNGSVMVLRAKGQVRRFHYHQPREGMRQAGVSQGTLLFKGRRHGDRYSGTAYVFSKKCGAVPYQVSGSVSDDQRRVELSGAAPVIGQNCSVLRYEWNHNSRLVFSYQYSR
jgi:hypothetical protein